MNGYFCYLECLYNHKLWVIIDLQMCKFYKIIAEGCQSVRRTGCGFGFRLSMILLASFISYWEHLLKESLPRFKMRFSSQCNLIRIKLYRRQRNILSAKISKGKSSPPASSTFYKLSFLNSQNTDSEKDNEDMNINAALVGMGFHAARFFFQWMDPLFTE